jgi:SEC-C motif-containing protein
MKKLSPNSPCPCGSGLKYKKCCQKLHNGAKAKNALELMKSRYSAYAANNAKYIIRTTHPNNSDYTDNAKDWAVSITHFCQNTEFFSLDILEFIDGEDEAFVTFKAKLSGGEMIEKSRFLKIKEEWLYESGEVSTLP